jgi:hypothetical protein
MASIPESALYKQNLEAVASGDGIRPRGWFHMSVVAAASALAGGVAAAWYYRKTLTQLRQAEGLPQSGPYAATGRDEGDDF